MVFLTYQSGPRRSDLRTVVLTAELAEGIYSALPWWNTKVHGRAAGDTAFEIAVELVRKLRVVDHVWETRPRGHGRRDEGAIGLMIEAVGQQLGVFLGLEDGLLLADRLHSFSEMACAFDRSLRNRARHR